MNAKLTHSDIIKWRAEFPILKEKIHLGNCSQSPQSLRVGSAIQQYLDNWRYVGMDWSSWMTEVNEAKQEFATLINADVEEISVSLSVSDATASVLTALPQLKTKNKIVTTMIEFPTIGQVALAQRNHQVAFVPVKNGRAYLQDYQDIIDDKTQLVCATHVYYQNGFKQDIQSLAQIAHKNDAWLYIDAYQSLGTEPVDVKAMNIDMLSSGTLKYLLGIPGIAFLYVRKEIAEQMQPAITGWFGQKEPFAFKVNELDYADATNRFDTGTPPVIAAYAAKAGLEIINEVNPRRIQQHILNLKDHIVQRCQELNLPIVGPQDPIERGATTAIAVQDSHYVEEQLMNNNIIVSARGPVIRLAPHFFTLKEDIDRTLELVKKLLN